MTFKNHFFATAALFCIALPAHAGQLFPPVGPCPVNTVLRWDGTHGAVYCGDATPAVNVSCPAGQLLSGISSGVAVCTSPATGTPVLAKVTGDIIGASTINGYFESAINVYETTNPNYSPIDGAGIRTSCEALVNQGKIQEMIAINSCLIDLCLGYYRQYPTLITVVGACDAPNAPSGICGVQRFNNNPVVGVACMYQGS